MVPTAQAVTRQFQLTFGCTRLQEREYFCSRLQSTLLFIVVNTCLWRQRGTSSLNGFLPLQEAGLHELVQQRKGRSKNLWGVWEDRSAWSSSACQIKLLSLQIIRQHKIIRQHNNQYDCAFGPRKASKWKNHPAEEWVCIAVVPNASTSSLAHALALAAHTYVCLLISVYSALRGCHTAGPSGAGTNESDRPLGLIVVTPW